MDSKGGFDAVHGTEPPNLGLKTTRTSIDAYSLKQSIGQNNLRMIWLASGWNLADALTKKKPEALKALEELLRSGHWRLRYDPNFIASLRKQGKSAVRTIAKHTRDNNGNDSPDNSDDEQLVAAATTLQPLRLSRRGVLHSSAYHKDPEQRWNRLQANNRIRPDGPGSFAMWSAHRSQRFKVGQAHVSKKPGLRLRICVG